MGTGGVDGSDHLPDAYRGGDLAQLGSCIAYRYGRTPGFDLLRAAECHCHHDYHGMCHLVDRQWVGASGRTSIHGCTDWEYSDSTH